MVSATRTPTMPNGPAALEYQRTATNWRELPSWPTMFAAYAAAKSPRINLRADGTPARFGFNVSELIYLAGEGCASRLWMEA
jgi:hypothetical protein